MKSEKTLQSVSKIATDIIALHLLRQNGSWLVQLAAWLALLTLSVFSLGFLSKGVTLNWAGTASQCI